MNVFKRKPIFVICFFLIFVLSVCPGNTADTDIYSGNPQITIEPKTISLGVATLMRTDIVFRGKGFTQGDSVVVKILDVKKEGSKEGIPVATAKIDYEGRFTTEVERLVKVTEFLRAGTILDDQMETAIVINQPPILSGTYVVQAVSTETNKKAETTITFDEPSLWDRFKDWRGRSTGRIIDRQKK
ncbi:MAG: hypothetical protein ACYDGO_14195 [Smithellaceae bacterium]